MVKLEIRQAARTSPGDERAYSKRWQVNRSNVKDSTETAIRCCHRHREKTLRTTVLRFGDTRGLTVNRSQHLSTTKRPIEPPRAHPRPAFCLGHQVLQDDVMTSTSSREKLPLLSHTTLDARSEMVNRSKP